MIFKYLDLPKLNNLKCLSTDEQIFQIGPWGSFNAFKIKDNDLLSEIQSIFYPHLNRIQNKRLFVWYQTIDESFNNHIHTDPREFGISYIIDTGGENVKTNFYNTDKTLLESHIIEPNKWHMLNGKVFHSVDNIKGKRSGISISLIKDVRQDFTQWLESKYI